MITGANSRVSTYYSDSTMNGFVEVGETSPGRVDVYDGATVDSGALLKTRDMNMGANAAV